MPSVTIDTKEIIDWTSFHQVFIEALGFPDYYGRNMNAWIDCMSDIAAGDSSYKLRLSEGERLHFVITDTSDFNKRLPDIMSELIECTAWVNDMSREACEEPKLSLVFVNNPI
jgi:hypothetical protein